MKQAAVRYESIINFIAQYVHDHIAEPLSIELLVEKTGVSRFHLNRLFHAATGFPLGEYVQRRRMEQAYMLLSAAQLSIIDIALTVGYESHSSFSRAFLKAFGRNPTDVKKGEPVHFAPPRLIKRAARPEILPEILTLQEQTLVGLYGEGFQDQSFKELAERLYATLASELELTNGFADSVHQLAGISLDSPWRGEQEQSQFFAGVISTSPDTYPRLSSYRWPAGRWARFLHRGSYQTMWQTISRIYAGWVIPQNVLLANSAIVQRYLNSPSTTPEHALETHLYLLLKED